MATTYALTTQPLAIYPGGFQSGLLIYNQGPGIVYLSDQANVTAANGWPVAKGSTLSWDEHKPLYAASDSTASIVTDTSTGSMTSAADVATALIDSGLPQDIANAISITGVPPLDDAQVIYSHTGTVPYGTQWTSGGPPYIDISKFQSVVIRIDATYNGTTGLNDTFTLGAFTLASANTAGNETGAESVECCLSQSSNYVIMQVPAQGGGLWLNYSINQSTGSTNQTSNITVSVIGSYRTVDKMRSYSSSTAITVDTPFTVSMDCYQFGAVVNLPASAGVSLSLPFINAPFDLSYILTSGAQTNGVDIYVSSATPNRQVAGFYSDKTAAFNIVRIQRIYMGGRMPRLWINNHDAVAKTYNISVCYQR